jgi:hypothetical protein
MLPTIIFVLALLFSWLMIVSNVNGILSRDGEASNINLIYLPIVLILWGCLYYLSH